jgi:uncharacterized protein (DUF305 family)
VGRIDRYNAHRPAASLAETGPEEKFLSENATAMTKMMANMMVKPSGGIDEDFVHMMIPDHQGAVDMARLELHHGHNDQLRRMSQEILINQAQEIVAMHLAIGEPTTAAPSEGKAE